MASTDGQLFMILIFNNIIFLPQLRCLSHSSIEEPVLLSMVSSHHCRLHCCHVMKAKQAEEVLELKTESLQSELS